jgi:hypothetical protein
MHLIVFDFALIVLSTNEHDFRWIIRRTVFIKILLDYCTIRELSNALATFGVINKGCIHDRTVSTVHLPTTMSLIIRPFSEVDLFSFRIEPLPMPTFLALLPLPCVYFFSRRRYEPAITMR